MKAIVVLDVKLDAVALLVIIVLSSCNPEKFNCILS